MLWNMNFVLHSVENFRVVETTNQTMVNHGISIHLHHVYLCLFAKGHLGYNEHQLL